MAPPISGRAAGRSTLLVDDAPVAIGIATITTGEPDRRSAAALASMPVAAVVERAPAPLAIAAAGHASQHARPEVHREVRVGDVFVELGDPLPSPPPVAPIGSLLASVSRPSFRPRRRL